MSQALRNEEMTVFGDGSQTRSVCYVSDLIEGIVRLLNSTTHEPVNIGNPDEVTMLQLAEEIKQLSKSESTIVFRDLPQDDPKVRQPDISRAQSILGWNPVVQRPEGLARTYEYFKAQISR